MMDKEDFLTVCKLSGAVIEKPGYSAGYYINCMNAVIHIYKDRPYYIVVSYHSNSEEKFIDGIENIYELIYNRVFNNYKVKEVNNIEEYRDNLIYLLSKKYVDLKILEEVDVLSSMIVGVDGFRIDLNKDWSIYLENNREYLSIELKKKYQLKYSYYIEDNVAVLSEKELVDFIDKIISEIE
jgi:hypothetical protein